MIASPPTPANPGPIISAGDLTVQECILTTPNVRNIVLGWLRPITVQLLSFSIRSGQATPQVRQEYLTAGIVQPMKAQEVAVQAGGDRSWKWYVLYSTPDLQLKPDDLVQVAGTQYRVMGRKDWSDFGYVRYELVEAPQNGR